MLEKPTLYEAIVEHLTSKLHKQVQDYMDTVCVTGTGCVKLSPEEIEHARNIYADHIRKGGHSGIYGDF